MNYSRFVVFILVFGVLVAYATQSLGNSTSMQKFETQIQSALQATRFGKTANGTIEIDLGDGALGYTGELKSGFFRKETQWPNDYFDSVGLNFLDLLEDLQGYSKNIPDGPIYKCIITIKKGKPRFNYYLENTPITSLDDIARDNHGNLPSFLFRKSFSKDLILASNKLDIITGHGVFVASNFDTYKDIPTHHLQIFALTDWISDTQNGGFNQYFSRNKNWGGNTPRKALYPEVMKGLDTIGHAEGAAIFVEAIALYAHVHASVEETRNALNITALPKQEESDINVRFYEITSDLEKAITDHIKANVNLFTYPQ